MSTRTRAAAFLPSEAQEQAALVQWLRLKGYKHFRVPNETYTKSWKQKAVNKALGVVPGVPDIFVVTPTGLVAIEMKRLKGSTTSEAQKEWIATLNALPGIRAAVCKGADAAIKFIEGDHD